MWLLASVLDVVSSVLNTEKFLLKKIQIGISASFM
jgi:hypothetical protein